jgi:hypothetical protein
VWLAPPIPEFVALRSLLGNRGVLGVGLGLRLDLARPPRLLALALHELPAKQLLCFVLIMGATSQAQVFNGRLATGGEWSDVIEFQELAGTASAASTA